MFKFFDIIGGFILGIPNRFFKGEKSMLSCLETGKTPPPKQEKIKTVYFNGEDAGNAYSITGTPLVLREEISDEASRCFKCFSIFQISEHYYFFLYEEEIAQFEDLIGWGRFFGDFEKNSYQDIEKLFTKSSFETEGEKIRLRKILEEYVL